MKCYRHSNEFKNYTEWDKGRRQYRKNWRRKTTYACRAFICARFMAHWRKKDITTCFRECENIMIRQPKKRRWQ